jgi:glycosyltransferase involved in cell wall biosynthesis
MADSDQIVAMIPAYNEEIHIGNVVKETKKYLPVWVIDDGSQDQTAAIAAQSGAIIITQTPNQGKGTALRRGFQMAIDRNLDAVVTLDADGQHDPREIPAFLNAFKINKPGLVIGQREFQAMPLIRRLANQIGQMLFSWAVGVQIQDNQSGYRLISQDVMKACLESAEPGFEFEVEMITICLAKKLALSWVPIRTIYADEKSHIQPLKHVLGFFRLIWKTRKSVKHHKISG